MESEGLYLGSPIDAATGRRGDRVVDLDPDDLATHGVIVGMTGSGKTGLGVIYVEEALRRGIPALIIDPKGDMTNLLLTFPDLAPSDFEPWMDEVEARREGKSTEEMARATADLWRRGLEDWNLDGGDIAALQEAAEFTIYTPGSSAGVPLDLIGSLRVPDADWTSGAEHLRDDIRSLVSGLLGLAGIDADPVSSREHILLSSLIEHGWRNATDLDLELLLSWIQAPPIRKLGVFDVDAFFPPRDRRDLAFTINAVVASPSFAVWAQGDPLDPQRLLWAEGGTPRASIVYLAHLSDAERQFVVALLLSRLVTWMRRQPGTESLRALVYLDEAFGFAPPVAEPPAKRPILTILKQGRASGIGMLVTTQNPMDLDYKAMSNAGTWNIGRLQTERDKARILEGLSAATGATDTAAFDGLISALDKRRFVLHSTRADAPITFTTRWAMSYLRGPLTAPQITRLVGQLERTPRSSEPPAETTLAGNETRVMPPVAEGVPVRFVTGSAPWAAAAGGATMGSARYRAVLVASVGLLYDDTNAGVNHREEWEAIWPDPADPFDPSDAVTVDHEPRDFAREPPEGAIYELPEAPLDTRSYFIGAGASLKDHLDRTASVTVYRNRDLKLYSRVGESRENFEARCLRAASEAADSDAARLRDKYAVKLDRARKRLESAERRAAELQADVEGAQQVEWTDLAGSVIDFLSGRRATRRLGGAARRRAAARSKEQRLESARDKAAGRRSEIAELDDELDDELEETAARWEEISADIEEMEIGLERSDITVKQLFVAWLPV